MLSAEELKLRVSSECLPVGSSQFVSVCRARSFTGQEELCDTIVFSRQPQRLEVTLLPLHHCFPPSPLIWESKPPQRRCIHSSSVHCIHLPELFSESSRFPPEILLERKGRKISTANQYANQSLFLRLNKKKTAKFCCLQSASVVSDIKFSFSPSLEDSWSRRNVWVVTVLHSCRFFWHLLF